MEVLSVEPPTPWRRRDAEKMVTIATCAAEPLVTGRRPLVRLSLNLRRALVCRVSVGGKEHPPHFVFTHVTYFCVYDTRISSHTNVLVACPSGPRCVHGSTVGRCDDELAAAQAGPRQ